MEQIRAIVVRVLRKDAKTGSVFATIRYESPTGLVDGKISGNGAEIEAGDFVISDGNWRQRSYNGRDEEIFYAKSIRPDLPITKDGAARWLSTIFTADTHGVTLATAKAFAQKHGDRVAHLCERNPELVLGLSRDPRQFRTAILRDWGRRISGRRAVVLLESSGVDPRAIDSILEAFRDGALETIQANPYRAARVRNVGFGNADKIGTHIGITKEDERRVGAALVEILDGQRMEGHSFARANYLGQRMEDQFGIPLATTSAFLVSKLGDASSPVSVSLRDGESVVMLREFHEAEHAIAKAAVTALVRGRKNPAQRAQVVLDGLFSTEKYSRFDAFQRAAVLTSVIEPISVLTGGPGTGKSTVSEVVVMAAEKLDPGPILLCAPTGKAAKRLEETTGRKASTIHHLLQAREDVATGRTVFGRNAVNPLPAGCFVLIDEASMIDIQTMQALLSAMPADGRLVLVGDKNQLPSVDAGAVLNDLMQATGPDGLRLLPCGELVNVYRQTGDSRIATGAAEIRQGEVPFLSNRYEGGVILYERAESDIVEQVRWCVTKACTEGLRLQPHQIAVLVPQAPGEVGTRRINRMLSRELNPRGRDIAGILPNAGDADVPIPRVGDRVMLTENDDENDVMNGDVGTIVDAYAKPTPSGATRNMIKVKFDCGHEVEYPAAQWRKLILAYAMTVHKSQGSQYPAVIMPVCSAHERMLDRSLLYTGWTRAKSSLFIVGERDVIEKAVANIEASKRDTRLQEFLRHFSLEMGLAGRPELPAIATPAVPRAAASAPLRRPPGPSAAPLAAARATRPAPPPPPRLAPRPLPGIGQTRAPAPQVSVTSVPVSPVRRPPPPPPGRPRPASPPPQSDTQDLHQIPSPTMSFP